MNTELPSIPENWRDAAIDAALRSEAANGQGLDALLVEVRRYQPGGATLLLWPDRLQLLKFLQTHATGFRNLLTGSDGHIEQEQVCPYIGWYAAEWEGIPVEVALSPGTYISSPVVVLAADQVKARAFSEALEEFAIRPAGRSLRYARHWESAPTLDSEIVKVTWDDVILAPAVIAGVRDAVEGFYKFREAFTTLGFPWRRGLLLIGPPGTGKTMLCKAAAASLPDLPFLYVRDFDKDQDHEDAITNIFKRARKLAPCLLAFEDIDGLVNDQNRTVFLNELDGFQNNNGLLIIASSNHPERIDEALLKRPSRFDRVFHIGLPARAERQAYCLRLLSRSSLGEKLSPELDIKALSQRVAEKSDGFTPAYLKEAFVSAALRQAQEGAEILDDRFADAVVSQVEDLKKHLRRLRNPDTLAEFQSEGTEAMGIRRNRTGQ